MKLSIRSTSARWHGTSSSTQSGRADTTSIAGATTVWASTSCRSSTSATGSTGFDTYRHACSRTTLSSVSGVSSAVITTTLGRPPSLGNAANTSSPFISGIHTSRSIRS